MIRIVRSGTAAYLFGSLIFLLTGFNAKAQLSGTGNAPDFTLKDIHGVEHRLYNYLDSSKVVVLDFFAVWCGICQSNTPVLEGIYEIYGPEGSGKIEMLSLEADNSTTDQEVNDFVNTFNSTNPHINNTENVSSEYKIPGFPAYYVIAPDRSYKFFSGIEINLGSKLADAIDNAPALREVDNDARIISFSRPSGTYCNTDVIPAVLVQNYGRNTIYELTIQLVVDGAFEYFHEIQAHLEPYEYAELVFNPLGNPGHGWHSAEFEIVSVNSSADAEENNGPDSGHFLYLEESEEVEVRLATDNYPKETSWQIFEDGKLASESLLFDKARTLYTGTVCLEAGSCYTLILNDSFGDGLSEGGIEVLYRGEIIASISSGSFSGFSSEVKFCLDNSSTGIDDIESSGLSLQVYPNPAQDKIFLYLEGNNMGDDQPWSLVFQNIVGQVLHEEQFYGSEVKKTLELSAFPDGIFFLRISKPGQVITKKILIRK